MNKIVIKYYITDVCNFTCDYCCVKSRRYKNLYTPTKEDIDNLIKNLKLIHIEMIEIYGGEPTLNKHLCYFIEETHKQLNVKRYKIFTNGTGKKEVYEKIAELRDIYNISIEILLSFHPKYSLEYIDNYHMINDLFHDDVKLKVLLDLRYKENIDTFLNSGINITNKVICLMENSELPNNNKSFDVEQNLNENIYHKSKEELIEFLKKFNYTIDDAITMTYYNPNHNKICNSNCLTITSTGYINYDGCFRDLSERYKNFNVYKNMFYYKNIQKKCSNKYIINVPRCLQHLHENQTDIGLSELDFGIKI